MGVRSFFASCQHPRLLLRAVGATGRWRQLQLQSFISPQDRANQSALLAAEPEQQLHFIVDGLSDRLSL
jgi:hypothetical protein